MIVNPPTPSLKACLHLLLAMTLLAGCSASISQGVESPHIFSALSSNGVNTCALDITGGVWCWGQNSGTPRPVSDLLPGNRLLSTGPSHSCIVSAAGGIKCWGQNQSGQLGDGSTTNSPIPRDASVFSGVARGISTGAAHTCAINAAGGVLCWGNNTQGQLGATGPDSSSTPLEVDGLSSGVSAISSGLNHTCALTLTGGVKCWGANQFGQLGNRSTTSSARPVDVEGLSLGVRAISAGPDHTCAITALGGVKCWGRNSSGQLGNSGNQDSSTPQDVTSLSAGVRAIAAGGDPADSGIAHTCAITAVGNVACWGSNAYGQLGDGSSSDNNAPVNVQNLGPGIRALSAGSRHTCALNTTGSALCWGDNSLGQLGDGSGQSSNAPITVK